MTAIGVPKNINKGNVFTASECKASRFKTLIGVNGDSGGNAGVFPLLLITPVALDITSL
jgi:hypothetical protein